MTERDLSSEAYERIRSEGLLGQRQLEAYHTLFHCGPLGRNELDRLAGDVFHSEAHSNPPWSRRLTELEKMGVARRVRVAACPQTGFDGELWDVTSQLPKKLDLKDTKPPKKKLAEAIEYISMAIKFMAADEGGVVPEAVQHTMRWLRKSNERSRKRKGGAQAQDDPAQPH